MKKLNIIEALAIVRSAPVLVDLEIYENAEEAVEYGAEAYKEYLDEGTFEPGDEVLEVIFEMIESISTNKGKPLHKYPAVSWFPGAGAVIMGRVEEGYLPLRGEILQEGIGGTYLYLVPEKDQSWYLAPWSVPEVPEVSEDCYRSSEVRVGGDHWSAIGRFGDGPEVFINTYQDLGWYVYRTPCSTTGYWTLVAYPEPLTCRNGRIQPA